MSAKPRRRRSYLGGILTALSIASLCGSAGAATPLGNRGDTVEAEYVAYVGRLTSYVERLRVKIKNNAPEVQLDLDEPPPKPLVYGYQILPALTDPAPSPGPRSELPVSTSYSWPITQQFIERERIKLEAAEKKLEGQQPDYQELAREYRSLVQNQKLADAYVQYNRFWQKEIANDRQRFDRQTVLYRLAVELRGANPEKADDLLSRIQNGQTPPVRPAFVSIDRSSGTSTVVRVPVYTDIEDEGFLDSAKAAIERTWHIVQDGGEYRVEVTFRKKTAKDLYVDSPAPAPGDHIDENAHLQRFPTDGAVLTTGTTTTHAFPGRSIVLGSQPLTWNVIAHEFGHILGFADGYFRGYQDLGEAGFEIFETIPDPGDIMCAPGEGKVRADHFRRLLAQ